MFAVPTACEFSKAAVVCRLFRRAGKPGSMAGRNACRYRRTDRESDASSKNKKPPDEVHFIRRLLEKAAVRFRRRWR